ncbi:hypothetical protein [Pseudomonas aeruginosa]|uniref:hypothetical protein n=1 Tax=Pseudomonas aeruginosa TaxID=287 RepID=UPI00093A49C1|nr:hypothetical protein [Pseudomonas aeruginosa]MBG4610110.1 hypothetical protein [Pseudomonas aeruginosa]MBG5537633.1 hypothetical protein [Pseudomonas aeruginosa]MBG5781822.1 hypothetical protein [Pseudomonas aeruginosa]MBT9112170.1 hypothetical protein [Pseudomonas aeruginosa]MBT9117911.1 hypothetical protein [Pseudomonas aeruginosa]
MQKPLVESPSVSALVDLLDGLKRVAVDFADQLPAAFSSRFQQLVDEGLDGAAKARYESHVRAAGDVPEGAVIDWEAPEVIAQVGTVRRMLAGYLGAKPITVTGNVRKFTPETNEAGAKPSNSVVVTGFQLVDALNFIAPDRTREQLARDVVIEYRDKSPDNPEGGLYAYDLEYPEVGSIPLEGTEVDVVLPEGQPDWGIFAGYLLDKCERETVTEENLQYWVAAMLKDPSYGPQFRREVGPHQSVVNLDRYEKPFVEGRKLIDEIAEHFAACGNDEWCARLDVYLKANPEPGDAGQAEEGGDDE